jgi:hypothetical protein
MIKYFIPVILLVVGGCSTKIGKTKYITKIETITIFKPVYTPPKEIQKMKIIRRPNLITNKLNESDKKNPGKVIKYVISSMAQLRTYAEQLEEQITTYRKILNKKADPIPENTKTTKTIEGEK